MESTQEFLSFIYKNAQMGVVGIDNILGDIKNKDLIKTIKEQRNDYQDISEKVKNYTESLHGKVEELSGIAKIMTYIDAKTSTINDKSTSNFALMMIKGSNKGIVEIEEKINMYSGEDKKALSFAKELLRIENKNISSLKKYLGKKED